MVDLMTAPDDLQDSLLNSYDIENVPPLLICSVKEAHLCKKMILRVPIPLTGC